MGIRESLINYDLGKSELVDKIVAFVEEKTDNKKIKKTVEFLAKRFVILIIQLFKLLDGIETLILRDIFAFSRIFFKMNE